MKTCLIGQSVTWSDSQGYHEGIVVAVAMDPRHGDIVGIIQVEQNKLIQRVLHGVTTK